jgi:ubiquinone/menaquinone biosynthesis C-methylase UbiE
MRTAYCLLLLTLIALTARAQKSKVERIPFCGKVIRDKAEMISQLQEQFHFLNVQEGDTIVDIGAASGWYEGAFSAASELRNVHFVLVDVDSNCLNQRKVDNMVAHYSGVKGSPITNQFRLVNNSYDSLFLPLATYKKVWLLNVLHEIPDPGKMISSICNILQSGGEITLLEMIPKKPGALHGGCRKPLLSLQQWQALFESNGFRYKEDVQVTRVKNRMTVNMVRFVKTGS